jgi:hypothetical protein
MGNTIGLLVTVLYGQELVRAAVELVDVENMAPELVDQLEWLEEPRTKELIHEHCLPLHVKSMGPVVKVERIFSVSAIPHKQAA